MKFLEDKIRAEGVVLPGHVLKVGHFVNHMIDITLLREMARELGRLYAEAGVTKVLTIEASGIALAAAVALEMDVPLVVLKKSVSSILKDGILQTEVFSFTKNTSYQLTLKKHFIEPGDKVLLIDDFLANGEAAFGGARLLKEAGAEVAGIGIVIGKCFQPGLAKLREAGFHVEVLAPVKRMSENNIEFGE